MESYLTLHQIVNVVVATFIPADKLLRHPGVDTTVVLLVNILIVGHSFVLLATVALANKFAEGISLVALMTELLLPFILPIV